MELRRCIAGCVTDPPTQGDDSKKHHRWRAPDVVDFKVKLPEFVYTNKVWGWDDVWEHLKRGEDDRRYKAFSLSTHDHELSGSCGC